MAVLALVTASLLNAFQMAAAETGTENLDFTIYFGGIRIGTVRMSAEISDTEFVIEGSITSSGLASALSGFGHASRVRGTIRKDEFRQQSYVSMTKTRKRQSEAGIVYIGDRPDVRYYRPEREPRDYDLVPAEQKGTLNPTIAAYFMLRDATHETLCDQTYDIYDGRRRTNLVLEEPEIVDGEATCQAAFKRVAGYSQEELDEKSSFETKLVYRRSGNDRFELWKITADSTIGTINMLRN